MMVQKRKPLINPLTPELKAVKVMAMLIISKTGNFSLSELLLALQVLLASHILVGKVVRKKFAMSLKFTSFMAWDTVIRFTSKRFTSHKLH